MSPFICISYILSKDSVFIYKYLIINLEAFIFYETKNLFDVKSTNLMN